MATPTTELVLNPGTGRAVPVLRGQVLRIEQLGDGQCVDFDAFNLHDYKEHFHTGRTRMMHGMFPTVGAMLWSNPPRDRPMYTIIADTVGRNDVNYPACSAFEYEYAAGFDHHTNCHDILAEAQREYGLTPDDVHDPFNLWLESGVGQDGMLFSRPCPARRGDFVELLAHIDTLAVASVCGDDLFGSSQFEMKPVKLAISSASGEQLARWPLLEERTHVNQRTPEDFIQATIKAGRELDPDPHYVPEWPATPVRVRELAVRLPDGAAARIEALRQSGRFGDNDGEIVRAVFFHWWQETYAAGRRADVAGGLAGAAHDPAGGPRTGGGGDQVSRPEDTPR